MASSHESDIAAALRQRELMTREADALEPGVIHRIIDFDLLEKTHDTDWAKISAAIGAELEALHPSAAMRKGWKTNLRFQKAMSGEYDMVHHFTDTSGHPGKLLVLGLPISEPLYHVSRLTGFSQPVCQMLGLDKQYSPETAQQFSSFIRMHEYAHWVAPTFNGNQFVDPLERLHALEMFGDVFATLSLLQRDGEKAVTVCETMARSRYIRGFNQRIDVLQNGEDIPADEHARDIAHMTGRGIYAAIAYATGWKKDLARMSKRDLLATAEEITRQHCFSSAELKEISETVDHATCQVASSSNGTSRKFTDIVSPCPEENRLQRALAIGGLDPGKPWVKEMVLAWEALIGAQIMKWKPPIDIPFTASVTRRDPLKPEPGKGRGGK